MKFWEELKEDKDVIAVYQFGSHKTKRQTPLSDIDYCIFTKKISQKKKLDLLSFGTEKQDLSIFDDLPIFIKPNVFRGKPLFIKDKFFVAKKSAKSFRNYQDFKKIEKKYWSELKKRAVV